MQRVKEFKDLELHYYAPSGLFVEFWTDMPGTAPALRTTLNFPPSTGTRRVHTLPLDGFEGNLYRIKVRSGGVVKLFGGVLRVRPIGVYFEGANGEVWDSLEQGIGV